MNNTTTNPTPETATPAPVVAKKRYATVGEAEAALRQIKADCQYRHIRPTGKIGKSGLLMDLFSASAILTVLDCSVLASKPELKEKYLNAPLPKAVAEVDVDWLAS